MKAKTDFYLRNMTGDKPQPVILYLTISRRVPGDSGKWKTKSQVIKLATLASVVPKQWDKKKKVPKLTASNREDILVEMSRVQDRTLESLKTLPEGWTPDQLRALVYGEAPIQPEVKEEKPEDVFFNAYREFIETQSAFSSPQTIKTYKTVYLSLLEFNAAHKVTFGGMDLKFYEVFRAFLLRKKHVKTTTSGLLNNTISKYIAILKTFLKWSHERGVHTNENWRQFKATRKAKNEIVTLSEEELESIAALDLSSNKRLEKVRDLFLFACYTGQRWSDVSAFRKEDFAKDTWKFIAVKTKKETTVPFTGPIRPAKAILEKYDGQLPDISEQKFNQYLKEVGELAGISEPVVIKRYAGSRLVEIRKPKHEFMSSHMARRTCVTLLLQKGVPPTTVMKLTGHSDLRTLLKYENTSQDALVAALNRIG